MKYHVTLEETTRTVYEVEASTEREARDKIMSDGGKVIGSEIDPKNIIEIEVAEDAESA